MMVGNMKKYSTCIVLLFISLVSFGQLQVGVKGGYDYFWFTHADESPYPVHYSYPDNSFMFAVSVRQRSAHVFNLGVEVQYVNRSFGVQSRWGGHGGGTDVVFDYNVGSLVLQIQPQFVLGSKFKFFIYPGIYVGTLLHSSLAGTSHSWKIGFPPYFKTDTLNGNAKGHYPSLEFGLSPGFGIEFPVYKNLNLVFEYNFTMNITSVGGAWGSDNTKMLNMSFEVGLAYQLISGL